MSDFEEEDGNGHGLAKEYRNALNARRRPSTRRLLASTESEGSLDSPLEVFDSDITDIVYRELDDSRENPTIFKKLSTRIFPQPIYNAIKPPLTGKEWKNFLKVHIPIWHWLFFYVPKLLIGDIVAGLTIGVTHIPLGTYVKVK